MVTIAMSGAPWRSSASTEVSAACTLAPQARRDSSSVVPAGSISSARSMAAMLSIASRYGAWCAAPSSVTNATVAMSLPVSLRCGTIAGRSC